MAGRVHAVSVDFPIKFIPQRNFRLLLTLCHGQGWPVGRFEVKLVLQSLHTRGRSRNWGCWWPGCGTKLAMNLHGPFSLKQPREDGEEKERVMWEKPPAGSSPLKTATQESGGTLTQEVAERQSTGPQLSSPCSWGQEGCTWVNAGLPTLPSSCLVIQQGGKKWKFGNKTNFF